MTNSNAPATDSAREGRSRRRVLFVSNHLLHGMRRTSIHFIARAYRDLGWRVDFVTVGFSPLSDLRRDRRIDDPASRPRNRWTATRPDGREEAGMASYVWYAPFHPVNLRNDLANRLSGPLFARYGRHLPSAVAERAAQADQIVIESGSGIMLAAALARLAPRAPIIYRVSDTLAAIRTHPVIQEVERRSIPLLSSISIASEMMRAAFPADAPLHVQPHGLEPIPSEPLLANPYAPNERAVISMGTMAFDAEAAEAACRADPQIKFHFFGHGSQFPSTANAVVHGEVPFEKIRPFLVHAAAGAAFYTKSPSVAYLADTSNKIMHFRANRLPVIAPDFVTAGRPGLFGYGADRSIADTLNAALAADRSVLPEVRFPSWREVAENMAAVAARG